MTPFQKRLTNEIIELIAPSTVGNVIIRIEKVPDEATVEIIVEDKTISFWIYEDEASVFGKDIDLRFETPDYRDQSSLSEAFLHSVRNVIANL